MALENAYITLNSQEYRLLREDLAKRAGTGRRWQVTRKKTGSTRIPRPDVRRGELDDEWVITWDDWSGGVAGDHDNLPGAVHYTDNVIPFYAGSLRPAGGVDSGTSSTDQEADPAIVLLFNGYYYSFVGRYVFRFRGGTGTSIKDFGAGYTATDAIVFNNEIVVGFGGSTKKIETMATSETFTEATNNTYADFFALAQNRLWRATATNEVSNIASTDNPLTLANWSTGIAVGDDDTPITDLNAFGERVVASKETGMFPGDQSAIFANVLPQFEEAPHPDNGKHTFVRGSDIFYPHRKGLIRYSLGMQEEIGIAQFLTQANTADQLPETKITAMAMDGPYIWAATAPTTWPRADPTGVLKTTDNEASFTDGTTNTTDNAVGTVLDISALDVAANGDYFYVGYSAPFFGFTLDLRDPNIIASVLTVKYWNGTAWAALPQPDPAIDRTAKGGKTLDHSDIVEWSDDPSDWATKSINSISAYWVRCEVSVLITNPCKISEVRVITTAPKVFIFRGRNREAGDRRRQSIIWESAYSLSNSPRITALLAMSRFQTRAGDLFAAGRQHFYYPTLPLDGLEWAYSEGTGSAYFQKHDGGMPEVNKQFLRFILKGSTIDSDRDVTLQYRTDEATSWTSVAAITSSPSTQTLTSITGYAIQPRIDFGAYANDTPTIVNQLECVFRELPTWKNEYTMLLELADGQGASGGGSLPDMSTALTNLEALQGSSSVTLIDPVVRSKTVTVHDVQEVELLQSDLSYPVMAVQVKCSET